MYDPAGWCRGRCARHGCADGGAAEKNNQKQQAQVHRGNGWRHWYLHVYKLYTALRSLYVVHRIAAVYIEFREPINLFSCELMIGRWWVLDILRLAWHICLVDICFLVRRKAAYVELSRGIAGRNRGSCALRWTQCSLFMARRRFYFLKTIRWKFTGKTEDGSKGRPRKAAQWSDSQMGRASAAWFGATLSPRFSLGKLRW
jgi:hypothetical protein